MNSAGHVAGKAAELVDDLGVTERLFGARDPTRQLTLSTARKINPGNSRGSVADRRVDVRKCS